MWGSGFGVRIWGFGCRVQGVDLVDVASHRDDFAREHGVKVIDLPIFRKRVSS